MPVYTYRCENCGVQFDRHQKFSDPPLTRCPECNKKALKKVIAPVGIVFKGSGFYATDHRSPSGGASRSGSEKAGKPAKTENTDKGDANGETKTSAPEPSKPAPAG
jgi:putative FmdB family regulatory protein